MVSLLRFLFSFFICVFAWIQAHPKVQFTPFLDPPVFYFVLRAENCTARDGEPAQLELTLIYTGLREMRVDHPVDGLCQLGGGRAPEVKISAPDGWVSIPIVRPNQCNEQHSGPVNLKRGDRFIATIQLRDYFSQIPFGRSSIRVTWPVFGDPSKNNFSPYPFAEPSVIVNVLIKPRLARKNLFWPPSSATP